MRFRGRSRALWIVLLAGLLLFLPLLHGGAGPAAWFLPVALFALAFPVLRFEPYSHRRLRSLSSPYLPAVSPRAPPA